MIRKKKTAGRVAPEKTANAAWKRIGATVRAAREQAGHSGADLANGIGLNPSTISRVETGEQGASIETLSAIANFLNMPLSQLMAIAEGAIMSVESPTAVLPVVKPGQVSIVLLEMKKPRITIMEVCNRLRLPYVNVDDSHGDAFMLDICGPAARSMSPMYQSGDRASISTTIKPEPGDHVVALVASEKDAVFRIYRPQPDGSIELAAINPDWPPIVINDRNPGDIVGVMTERRHRRPSSD